MSRAAYILTRIADLVTRSIGVVAAGVLAGMMFLTTADVLLRYLFNSPVSGSIELTQYMMAIIVAFGLAYCGIHRGHVKVELLTSRLSPQTRSAVNCVTSFICLGIFALITRQSIIYTGIFFTSKITSSVLLIPAFPFVGILALGGAIFCLVFLVEFLDSLSKAVRK